jgi:hypothetical protein
MMSVVDSDTESLPSRLACTLHFSSVFFLGRVGVRHRWVSQHGGPAFSLHFKFTFFFLKWEIGIKSRPKDVYFDLECKEAPYINDS